MNLSNLKKVIVLSGCPDSGKTTILEELCRQVDSSPLMTAKNPKEQEVTKEDQRYAATYNGSKVAIVTAGDNADLIFKAFLYAEKVQASILVMALSVHSKGYKTAEESFDVIVKNFNLAPDMGTRTTQNSHMDQKVAKTLLGKI